MNALPPSITGDFSISDLVREAAERAITVHHVIDTSEAIATPAMSGMMLAEQVQPGLLLSGYDLTYIAQGRFEAEVERSVFCGVLLGGEAQPMYVEGHGPVAVDLKHPLIIGYGEKLVCSRSWSEGQQGRAFGLTIQPGFFERFASFLDGDGLDALHGYLKPGFHSSLLPWSWKIIEIAEGTLGQPYAGALRTLHREAQALRFLVEMVSLLEEKRRIIGRIGQRYYDRVRQAREMLDRSLAAPPKLLDLAREIGINVTTLQANFKAAFGTTIFGYVRDRRLEIGRALILEHGLGVAEAGYKVGFTNAAAFTAAYRRHFGHPPSMEIGSHLHTRPVRPLPRSTPV